MERLRLLREERKISRQKLADSIGTNQQNIHRYEHGFYEPDIGTLKLIANFFGTSVDCLIGNTDMRHRIEPVQKFDLNGQEADMMGKYRNLPDNARRGVDAILDALAEDGEGGQLPPSHNFSKSHHRNLGCFYLFDSVCRKLNSVKIMSYDCKLRNTGILSLPCMRI